MNRLEIRPLLSQGRPSSSTSRPQIANLVCSFSIASFCTAFSLASFIHSFNEFINNRCDNDPRKIVISSLMLSFSLLTVLKLASSFFSCGSAERLTQDLESGRPRLGTEERRTEPEIPPQEDLSLRQASSPEGFVRVPLSGVCSPERTRELVDQLRRMNSVDAGARILNLFPQIIAILNPHLDVEDLRDRILTLRVVTNESSETNSGAATPVRSLY